MTTVNVERTLATIGVVGLSAFVLWAMAMTSERNTRHEADRRFDECKLQVDVRHREAVALADSLVLEAKSLSSWTGFQFDFSGTAHNPTSKYSSPAHVVVSFYTADDARFDGWNAEIGGIEPGGTVLFTAFGHTPVAIGDAYAKLGSASVGPPNYQYCR